MRFRPSSFWGCWTPSGIRAVNDDVPQRHEMKPSWPDARGSAGDVLLGDRAFLLLRPLVCSRAMAVDAVFRTHQAQIVSTSRRIGASQAKGARRQREATTVAACPPRVSVRHLARRTSSSGMFPSCDVPGGSRIDYAGAGRGEIVCGARAAPIGITVPRGSRTAW